MAVNSGPDGIVEDGLVFYVDAANKESWSGPDSSNVNDLISTPTGSIFNDTSGSYGDNNSFAFDGVDDKIPVSNVNYTIYSTSIWFKPNSSISTTSTQQFLIYYSDTNYNPQKYIRLGGGENIISITMGSGESRYYSGADIPNTQWSNVVTNYNGAQYDIYLNGVDVTNTRAASISSSDGIIIGNRAQISAPFDGDIGPVLLYNNALSSTEIKQNYNALKPRFT